jgi:hypothetical protein
VRVFVREAHPSLATWPKSEPTKAVDLIGLSGCLGLPRTFRYIRNYGCERQKRRRKRPFGFCWYPFLRPDCDLRAHRGLGSSGNCCQCESQSRDALWRIGGERRRLSSACISPRGRPVSAGYFRDGALCLSRLSGRQRTAVASRTHSYGTRCQPRSLFRPDFALRARANILPPIGKQRFSSAMISFISAVKPCSASSLSDWRTRYRDTRCSRADYQFSASSLL